MMWTLPYDIGRALVRFALSVYFRGLHVSGRRNIPVKGPVIIASTHPQSVTDGLVLAAGTPRAVHFIAHGGLFKNPVRGWLLRACGAIPVYRSSDAADASQRNVETFSACEKALEEGGAIAIFPEGVSTEERRVHKLKTGTARIALQTEAKNGWTLGVSIVPVGLSFESRTRMRTRVLVSFGEPVAAAPLRGEYEKDPVEAVRRLNTVLEDRLRRLVVDIERPEYEDLVREVERIYTPEFLEREYAGMKGLSKFERGHVVSLAIPRVLDYFLEHRPEAVWPVERMMEEYRWALERARIRDDELRDAADKTFPRELARLLLAGTLGLPFAVYGALANFVPYKLTGALARLASKDETKIHYHQLVFGALVFPIWYTLPVYFASRVLGPWATAVFAVSLPPCGLFARGYVRWLVRHVRLARFAWLRATRKFLVQKIAERRRRVIDEMNALLAEYLGALHEASLGMSSEERGRDA